MKTCSQCKTLKQLSDFSRKNSQKDGLNPRCKKCDSVYQREYYLKNSDKIKNKSREWANKHPEESRERSKRYFADNAERVRALRKKWADEHRDIVLESGRKFRLKNRNNPTYRLRHCMSNGIYESLKGDKSRNSWEGLVDFGIDALRQHLQKQFKPGMTWENYGTEWHVDHKIPVSVFHFEQPNDIDFRKCWSLNNLQPLNAMENRIKHAKLDRPFQPSLTLGYVNA